MEHTIKVYKDSPEHGAYMKARFPKDRRHSSCSNETFEFRGHRWKYRVTSFDDKGDYDLLYRFDDKADSNELMLSDISFRDYIATEAMNGILVNTERNHFSFGKVDEIAAKAYELSDAMLIAREK